MTFTNLSDSCGHHCGTMELGGGPVTRHCGCLECHADDIESIKRTGPHHETKADSAADTVLVLPLPFPDNEPNKPDLRAVP